MTEPRNRIPLLAGWLSNALILAAFSLFSPLSLLAVNAPRGASPVKFFVIAGGAFLLAGGLVVVLTWWLGQHRATGIGAVLLVVFFSWSQLRLLGIPGPDWVQAIVVPLLILALLAWAAVRFGSSPAFRFSLAAAGIALVATPLPALLAWYAGKPVRLDVQRLDVRVTGPSPDVYFIVLDGYGRTDVLEDVYGFSNQQFIADLESRGFEVPAQSRSNYSSTAGSVASTLAMGYLVEAGTVPDHRVRLALYEVTRGANPVVATLRDSGYHYVHIESGWDGSRCGPQVDTCYPAAFLDEAIWTLSGRTPLAPSLESRFGHAFALNGLRGLESLRREVGIDRSTPRFVFAHAVLPHPPLTLDSQCVVRPEPLPVGGAVGARFLLGTEELTDRRAGYVDQIECVNAQILRFLQELDDDALVFITGDHGPDSFGQMSIPPAEWTGQDIRERFAVFSAYRLPTPCSTKVESDLDLINGMRKVIGCIVQEELPVLPSHSYIFPLADGPPNPTTEIDTAVLGG